MCNVLAVMSGIFCAFMAQTLSAERNDPTRPAAYVALNSVEIRGEKPILSSILISKNRRLAVVDGHILKEGDTYQGLVISKIDSDAVRVLANNKMMILELRDARKSQ